MTVVAVLLGLGGLVLGWLANSRSKEALERLDRISSATYDLSTRLQEATTKLKKDLTALQLDVQGRFGELRFRKDMTIGRALDLHPGVKEVLAQFHIGGCSSCAVNEEETFEQAAGGHGVSLDQMLTALNSLPSAEEYKPGMMGGHHH